MRTASRAFVVVDIVTGAAPACGMGMGTMDGDRLSVCGLLWRTLLAQMVVFAAVIEDACMVSNVID